jgi:hypothetical protein
MKNVITIVGVMIIFAFITLASCGQNETKQNELGQTIQKGNLVSIRTLTVELKPNVTMEQVLDFYNTKWAPAAEKYFGWKFFYGKCLHGTECAENKILNIVIFETEADRDKYFKMDEGGNDLNELGEKAWAQFAPTNDALQQLATTTEEWGDWLIK